MHPAVQDALSRRYGAPTPQLSQVSQGAPMQGDMPLPPMNPSDLQGSSTPSGQAKPAAQKYQAQNQTDLVLMALTEFLKNEQKFKKEQSTMGSAPQLSQAPAGMGAPTLL